MPSTDSAYVGEIMMYGPAGPAAITGWLPCDGATYDGTNPAYTQLFSRMGLAYGGSGSNFKVPDFRGVFPTTAFTGHPIAERYPTTTSTGTPGQAPFSTTLTTANLPAHNHPATFTGSTSSVTGANAIRALTAGPGAAGPSAGSILGNSGTGTGAGLVYLPSGTSGTAVNLDGGTLTLSGTPNGSVAVANTGSGTPVTANAQVPYLTVRFFICYQGIYLSGS